MAGVFQVDAFTCRPFAGNPAAVVVDEALPDAGSMQNLAAELQQPATAFVAGTGRTRELRWFTAVAELSLCGHGTLAAAHVLWETESLDGVDFETAAGTIAARRRGSSVFITLEAGKLTETDPPGGLDEAVGSPLVAVWRTPLDYLVELESAAAVAALKPKVEEIARIDTRGLIVTAAGGESVDFTSRFFAPRLGLPEDSVTGSAHASLAPFWAQRFERSSLRAYQASPRGGYVDLRVDGDAVEIGGEAVTVARGALAIRLADRAAETSAGATSSAITSNHT
jgi:predicted PhzF superfamily epimerase YddE/YHI9